MAKNNDGYEIALQRIAECKRTKATELDLSGLRLREVPEDIASLLWLTKLNLGVRELVNDVYSINFLTMLPESITCLANLSSLDLKNNRLTTLPESITRLTNLVSLNLSSNYLTTLPESITHLTNLSFLDLSYNRLTTLPESITRLTNLSFLDLSENELMVFPQSIAHLFNLSVLDLSDTQLSTLPEIIIHLTNLTHLYLSINELTTLPESMRYLTNLTFLNLDSNFLTRLPESISRLTNLTSLNLSLNELTALPYSITRLHRLTRLDLRGNRDLTLPSEFLENPDNAQAILDYLRATHLDRPVLLNEVKVLIVGEAEVGKTTLVRTVLGEKVDIEAREPTPGIVVRDDKLIVKDREMVVHFWDFGGQEIMHNTHRLFLTTRSCYLLVLDATQNEEANKVVEWLKTIHLYAPDAPVILVINKWDKFKLRLNVPALEQHHPIAAVIETSCATQEGINRLRTTLQQELATLKHLNDEIPAKWMEVRKQVGTENRDYLEYQEFEDICAAHEVAEGTYTSVATLLHDLGVLFTYSNDPNTKLTHILNPNWVTGGIYPILNDPELLQGRGFVTDGDIGRVLIPKGYPRDKHPFILSMMFVFELAYRLDETRYLVPDLLPKSPPPYEWQSKGALRFVYHYDFVPPGLFSRFVVRMRDEVNPEQVWRTGVILHQHHQPYGRVIVDTDAKRIEIAIALPEEDHRDRRTLLDTLRDKFKRLHDDYAGVEVQELVPITNTKVLVEYRKLVYWAERGLYQQSDPDAGDFDVRVLLNGISARTPRYGSSADPLPSSLGERRKRLVDILIREFPSPTHLEDFLYFEELEAYLAEIHWNTPIRDVSREVVRTLERAGVVPDSGTSVLGILLHALMEKASGHPNDVAFLRAWVRDLG